MESSQRENLNNLFCRKVSFLTSTHGQFRGVGQGMKQTQLYLIFCILYVLSNFHFLFILLFTFIVNKQILRTGTLQDLFYNTENPFPSITGSDSILDAWVFCSPPFQYFELSIFSVGYILALSSLNYCGGNYGTFGYTVSIYNRSMSVKLSRVSSTYIQVMVKTQVTLANYSCCIQIPWSYQRMSYVHLLQFQYLVGSTAMRRPSAEGSTTLYSAGTTDNIQILQELFQNLRKSVYQ